MTKLHEPGVRTLIKWATCYLKSKKIDSPRLTAELIAEKIIGRKRVWFYIGSEISVDKKKASLFKREIRRRARGVPLAYITGEQQFMGYKFFIPPGVYIPRADTEVVVEKCIEILNRIANHHSPIVIDLGTGSGSIAVSIAKKIKNAFVYAIDISSLAIKVAKYNAKSNKVQKRIEFLLGDLFLPLEFKNLENRVDLIVSNPPYIERKQMRFLPPEVKKEPDFALNGGKEGLNFYKRIIPESLKWLKKGGNLVLEIGYNQADKVKKIVETKKNLFTPVQIINDLNGNPRVVVTSKK
ncbi:peptide chain release factor N(5)-glutamine methyltransferase [Candidatus Aerophobetes bacterium]|uniref:Release factor glutamine methyltransferase n=1 Tax=Aerophobetes bacterium TaxID=2030807 RepID=A0A662DFS1_UNCAE|nr:MAG: peptide chain release factor N(5)-glutamine methyltransferase [Candidatus Aerophobetes bacterium]